MPGCQDGLQRLVNLGHHRAATHVPGGPGVQCAHVLLLHRARPDGGRLLGLPAVPQQLGALRQRAHLLQRGGQHPASQHDAVLAMVRVWLPLQLPGAQARVPVVEAVQLPAAGGHGHGHGRRDGAHILRAELHGHDAELVGQQRGQRHGRCELGAVADGAGRRVLWEGAWRVLSRWH